MADKTSGVDVTSATQLDATGAEIPDTPRHGFFNRLYTGTGGYDVMGKRKIFFAITALMVAIAAASILLRGFTFGIDFQGGTKVGFPRGEASVTQVEQVFTDTIGTAPESVVTVGNGPGATVQIRSKALSNEETEKLRNALFEKFQPKGADGKPSKQAISDSAVSETWGDQITKKALIALGVFLFLVGIYLALRYERYMAVAALSSLSLDVVITAGIYSLIGFEVTPATVIGLLTILGYSLYDTVIVFDKVEENTKDFQHTTRRTFAEQANLAVNQTFMRSINTSIISIMPVLALMVVAVWLLGVGTLKDLSLVLLIGILAGNYSSIFFATPLLVSLRERTKLVRDHTRRVLNRRRGGAGSAEVTTAAVGEVETATVGAGTGQGASTPVRPVRPRRPSGKRER
ncbi:protein translocase subunit SecF [Mycolicibacterium sp.]|uniref:protein translocase subunit SecF n=1 Tax=Mycolicibacterium sp. TaxID=2320850 RepID=UPI0028A5EEB8|nr:protein translocase subunit SecF [Mycolicibacterium sp.]